MSKIRSRTRSEGEPVDDSTPCPCGIPGAKCSMLNDSLSGLEDATDVVKLFCSNFDCFHMPKRGFGLHSKCFDEYEHSIIEKANTVQGHSSTEKATNNCVWSRKFQEANPGLCPCSCGEGSLSTEPLIESSASPGNETISTSGRRGSRRRGGNGRKAVTTVGNPSMSTSHSVVKVGLPSKSGGMPVPPKAVSRLRPSPCESFSSPESPRSGSGSWHNSPPGSRGMGYRSNSAIIQRRIDYQALQCNLDPSRYNIYHVKMEDELGGTGGSDARSLLHQCMTSTRSNSIGCLVCGLRMHVYDKYPLLDGTAFISCVKHSEERSLPIISGQNANSPTKHEHARMFMSAICARCLDCEKGNLACRFCSQKWFGAAFQIGAVYLFDILAAPPPCCPERQPTCGHCGRSVFNAASVLNYAELGSEFACSNCSHRAAHLVKTMNSVYCVLQPNAAFSSSVVAASQTTASVAG